MIWRLGSHCQDGLGVELLDVVGGGVEELVVGQLGVVGGLHVEFAHFDWSVGEGDGAVCAWTLVVVI